MSEPAQQPKRRWPWFVLAGVILFLLSTSLWIYREVQRVKWMKAQRATNTVYYSPAQRLNPDTSGTNGMIWIPGGSFWMGSEEGQADEKPLHEVTVDGFWIDEHEVTNE